MRATRRRNTAPEVALWQALARLGCEPTFDFPLPDTRRRADAAIPEARIAVFVDGCFWHGCPEHGTWPRANAEAWRSKILANQGRDRSTDELLARQGWTIIRAWEHEDAEAVARSVVDAAARAIGSDPTGPSTA
jgi:DNA mismatch endonuclease (patch repair protein)